MRTEAETEMKIKILIQVTGVKITHTLDGGWGTMHPFSLECAYMK